MPNERRSLTFDELRNMSREELEKKIDEQISRAQNPIHNFLSELYLAELVRREQSKATESMIHYTNEVFRFTKQIRDMTIIILFLTLLGLIPNLYYIFKP